MPARTRGRLAGVVVGMALIATALPAYAKQPAGVRYVEFGFFVLPLFLSSLVAVALAPWTALLVAGRRARRDPTGPHCATALRAGALGTLAAVVSSLVVLGTYLGVGGRFNPEVAIPSWALPAVAAVLTVWRTKPRDRRQEDAAGEADDDG